MDREEITHRLTAIMQAISFMSDHEVEQHFSDGKFMMKFDNFCWDEPAKIQTEITMTKIKVEE